MSRKETVVAVDTLMKEKVLKDLNSIPELNQKIDLLRYELNHRSLMTSGEMIDTLSFRHGDGSGGASGHVSDKTLYIALNYREKMEEANKEVRAELVERLWVLETKRDRILHYISLLEQRQEKIVRLTCIEQKTYEEAALSMGITVRTARRLKGAAVEQLCKMYSFAGNNDEPS